MTEEQYEMTEEAVPTHDAVDRRLAKLEAQAYLAALIAGLVNDQESVRVSVSGECNNLILAINAPYETRRFIIGRRGRIIESVRDILHSYGARTSLKIEVRVIEDQHGETGNGQSKRY